MTPDRFADLLDRLAAAAHAAPDVVGLVAFGSTAETGRADEGSDHDFAWIVQPGAADRYRHDLGWLPDPQRIAASAVEHHGGVKVLYDDGHRLEFGIADLAGFAGWAGAPLRVIVGDDAVRAAATQVAAHRPEGEARVGRELTLFLTQLLSGVGRARRGEVQSAAGLVRGEAVGHLLRAIAAAYAPGDARLDALDPRRRFERVFPRLGTRIEAASRQDPVSAAAELLGIAEDVLGEHPEFPARGFGAARARIVG
jgi:hypothetical protein